jgi:hypothetical protein
MGTAESDANILRTNEQIKGVSNAVANTGTALFAAGFGRWFFSEFDAWVVVWLVFGIAITTLGIHLLSYLRADGSHE